MKDEELRVEDLEGIEAIVDSEPEKPKRSRSRSSSRSPSKASLEKRLKTMIELIGNVTSGFDQFDGLIIRDSAEDLAKALVDLANENPRARRVLEGMLEGSAWAGVGAVVGWQIVTPIAVHHRMLPEPINTNLAEIRGIPLRERRVRPEAEETTRPTLTVVVDEETGEDVPYVEARDPKTGEIGMFPADGNGRPIFPPPSDDDPVV